MKKEKKISEEKEVKAKAQKPQKKKVLIHIRLKIVQVEWMIY